MLKKVALLPRNKPTEAVPLEFHAVNSHLRASHVVLVIVDSCVTGEAGRFKSFDGHSSSLLRSPTKTCSQKRASGGKAEGRDHCCSNIVFCVVCARCIALQSAHCRLSELSSSSSDPCWALSGLQGTGPAWRTVCPPSACCLFFSVSMPHPSSRKARAIPHRQRCSRRLPDK